MFYLHATIGTLPPMDLDELLCTQGQIFLRNLRLPGEFSIDIIRHIKKGKKEPKSTVSKLGKNKQRTEQTCLALRTCSRLEGSIPCPEHETKTKSVSCPVCSIFTCKIYIRMISIININTEFMSSTRLVKNSLLFCSFLFSHCCNLAEQDLKTSNERIYTIQVLFILPKKQYN